MHLHYTTHNPLALSWGCALVMSLKSRVFLTPLQLIFAKNCMRHCRWTSYLECKRSLRAHVFASTKRFPQIMAVGDRQQRVERTRHRFDNLIRRRPPFISPAKNHNLFRQHLSKPLAFRRTDTSKGAELTNCEKASEADKTADAPRTATELQLACGARKIIRCDTAQQRPISQIGCTFLLIHLRIPSAV